MAVVVNGRAKQVTEELVETLDQIVQSGDLFVSRSLEEGKEIARIIVERGLAETRARAIKEGLSRLAETSILDRYV